MKMACPHYSFIDISPSFFNVMFSPSEFLAIAWLPCVCQWFPRFHDSCISPLYIIAFCCDDDHTPNYIEASDKWNHQVAELCIQTYLQASFPKPRGDRASPMAEARIHDLYLTPLASTKSFVRASLCVCKCVYMCVCRCVRVRCTLKRALRNGTRRQESCLAIVAWRGWIDVYQPRHAAQNKRCKRDVDENCSNWQENSQMTTLTLCETHQIYWRELAKTDDRSH